MFRGKTFFRCTQCGKIFVATDIEYGATIYSCPQPCKRCGGIRTLLVLHTIFISVYEKLWENMKKKIRILEIFISRKQKRNNGQKKNDL